MAEISGKGTPTNQTAAAVGDIYTDTDTLQKYKCDLAYVSKDEKGNDFPYYIWIKLKNESPGSGGTTDYTNLTNKPQINSVNLVGNKTSADLSLLDEAAANKLIDTKLSNLKEDLCNVESTTFTIEKGSTNVFDYTNITSGKILKQDIGISKLESYQDSAKGFVSNQIWDVKKGDIIYTTSAYCGLCIYDASGTLQEYFNDENKNHTVTVDSARFLRYYCSSSSSTYTTDFMLSINEVLPTDHEEYKPDKN